MSDKLSGELDVRLAAEAKITRAMHLIAVHHSAPIVVRDIARSVDMSVSRLHRQFRVATTLTPVQFHRQVRLYHARLLLRSTGNVTATARSVGYASRSQFSRDYKRHFGVTPAVDARTRSSPLAP